MTRWLYTLTVLGLLAGASLYAPPASADEAEAESCLRTKVWASYEDGWAVRTLTSAKLAVGATQSYRVTLYKGTPYQITTCGDRGVKNLDVLLYDSEGKVVTRGDAVGREPSFSFTPEDTATYFVVLYLRELAPQATEGSAAMAVSYK